MYKASPVLEPWSSIANEVRFRTFGSNKSLGPYYLLLLLPWHSWIAQPPPKGQVGGSNPPGSANANIVEQFFWCRQSIGIPLSIWTQVWAAPQVALFSLPSSNNYNYLPVIKSSSSTLQPFEIAGYYMQFAPSRKSMMAWWLIFFVIPAQAGIHQIRRKNCKQSGACPTPRRLPFPTLIELLVRITR